MTVWKINCKYNYMYIIYKITMLNFQMA